MHATRQPSTALLAVGLALVAALGGCGNSTNSPAPSGSHAAPAAVSAAPAAPNASPWLGGSGGPPAAEGGAWEQIPDIVADLQPSVVAIRRDGGEGSGVIWSADGVVVTNHHVIEGATEVLVVFGDGTRTPGRVEASDPLSDLAIVRVERTGLPAAEFAPQIPAIGTLAVAMGNPLGFENSATAGIISGVHRAVPGAAQSSPALVDLIQTDAAISPGNSGGALVGPDRTVMGINVAYIPPQVGSVSIGFSIPAPTVVDVVTQLLETGTAKHPWLGVQPIPLTPQIAQQFGIGTETGVLVVEVAPDGPADRAGVQPGDVIVAVDGRPVETVEDLLGALRRHDPGSQVTIRILRGQEEREVTVTLGEYPTPGG